MLLLSKTDGQFYQDFLDQEGTQNTLRQPLHELHFLKDDIRGTSRSIPEAWFSGCTVLKGSQWPQQLREPG
jgi:hypothetical protein